MESGGIICFSRGAYKHIGMFVMERDVPSIIHLWRPDDCEQFCVRLDTLSAFPELSSPEHYTTKLDRMMSSRYSLTPFTMEESVQRMRSKIGDARYDVVSYNCEHLVTWARYGRPLSLQVNENIADIAIAAYTGAVVLGPVGFVLATGFTIWSKLDALTTSMSASSQDSFSRASTGMAAKFMTDYSATPSIEDDVLNMDISNALVAGGMECGICLEDLKQKNIAVFPCRHYACTTCFDSFQISEDSIHPQCPFCRRIISSIEEVNEVTKQHALQYANLDE